MKNNREHVRPGYDYEAGYSWVHPDIRGGASGYYFRTVKKVTDDCREQGKSCWATSLKREPVTCRVANRCFDRQIDEYDELMYWDLGK